MKSERGVVGGEIERQEERHKERKTVLSKPEILRDSKSSGHVLVDVSRLINGIMR